MKSGHKIEKPGQEHNSENYSNLSIITEKLSLHPPSRLVRHIGGGLSFLDEQHRRRISPGSAEIAEVKKTKGSTHLERQSC